MTYVFWLLVSFIIIGHSTTSPINNEFVLQVILMVGFTALTSKLATIIEKLDEIKRGVK